MRLTIVADDNSVGIDNEFIYPVDISQLDSSIHAVQWYGEYGEIEYKTKFENGVIVKPQNVFITDITPYEFAIDAWKSGKAILVAQNALILEQADT
jgi:hypothetical protein